MGTNSLPAPAPRRRSFNLPSFRRSSAAERQEVVKTAEELMARSNAMQEAARIQKAAAWQWYTRGAGEAVRPTKPPARNPQAPVSNDKICVGAASGLTSTANVRDSSMQQQKIVNPRPLAETDRAASRFKAEARFSNTGPAASGGAPPAAPSGGLSTPLYDELELSGLRTHMADFVQRLKHHDNPDQEHSSPARPPPPSVSNDHHQTKAPPAVAVASAGDHQQLTTLPCSPAPVASAVPFHIKPFSALQKLLRKVLSGSVPKCTKNSAQIIDAAPSTVYAPAEVYNDVDSTNEYHHHHYIHHHHHHYHFSKSPEEQASISLSSRRHSESGSSRPCTPTLIEADSDEEEDLDEVEERRIEAYLARRRRRRHSDSLSRYQLPPEDANFDKDEAMKEEFAQVGLPMQFWRRYNSERFLASQIPTMSGKDNTAQPAKDQFDEGALAGIRRRRRQSAELRREQPSLAQTGGKSERGLYVLGGAGAGSEMQVAVRRRHSENSKESPEAGAKQTSSPGTPYWKSPSTRYYVDVQERHIGDSGLLRPRTPLAPR